MRDPKVDPKSGDVLRGKTGERTVNDRQGNDIYWYLSSSKSPPKERCCWISTWRDWAKKATVVKVSL